jgi:hypothetical protein
VELCPVLDPDVTGDRAREARVSDPPRHPPTADYLRRCSVPAPAADEPVSLRVSFRGEMTEVGSRLVRASACR